MAEGKKKKKLKRLIRFHSSNKIDNYNRVGGEFKIIYRASQDIGIIEVFLESLLSESFPSLGVTVHLTSLGCRPTLLVSGPAVRAAQTLIWPCSREGLGHNFSEVGDERGRPTAGIAH